MMRAMPRSKIEYGTHSWTLVSGCRHGVDICAVSAECWARDMAHRFRRDFTPTLHPERLSDRMPCKPSRILVSFTGDMFGEWWRTPELGEWDKLVLQCLARVSRHPEHQFLFLTKNPAAYRLFNPWPAYIWMGTSITGAEPQWPANSWLGASITGAEPREVQQARLDALRRVEGARVLWVSYEPMLGPLAVDNLGGINWLVMGAHNKGLVKPECAWVDAAWDMADAPTRVVDIWEKNNLRTYLDRPWGVVQDLPREVTNG